MPAVKNEKPEQSKLVRNMLDILQAVKLNSRSAQKFFKNGRNVLVNVEGIMIMAMNICFSSNHFSSCTR